ncbi:unnamed protein product, partial [Ceratitis capitata]
LFVTLSRSHALQHYHHITLLQVKLISAQPSKLFSQFPHMQQAASNTCAQEHKHKEL